MTNAISPLLDRTGILASVFCALHCAAAPILLIAAPTLGGLWVHPLSHLAIAGLVLPVAAFALRGGFRQHGRLSVLALGGVGIALVLLGAVLPFLLESGTAGEALAADAAACDQCCPSLVIDEATGEQRLNIPPASIITLLGGIALVTAHAINLRCCSRCRAGVAAAS